jgi:Zn-dependent protease
MLRSFRVGSLFGIDIYIHSTFFLLPLLVVAGSPAQSLGSIAFLLALVFAVFGCVVLHELGHALMARRFGINTLDITLYPIGGVARLERLPERPTEELLIAVAGPAVNVAIAALLTPLLVLGVFLARGFPATAQPALVSVGLDFLGSLLAANVGLVLFNLLPTFPMDGGRVLRALLSYRINPVKATTVAVVVGRVLIVAGLGALLVFAPETLTTNFMLPVVAVFVFYVGQQELAAIRYREAARQAAQPIPVPMLRHGLFEPAEMVVDPGFSGITWDQQSGIGIHWYNGRPVGTFTLPTE